MNIRFITLIAMLTLLVSFIAFSNPDTAQAILTLNNFVGFETNGLDELASSSGNPQIIGTNVHSGDFVLNFPNDSVDIFMITGGSTDSDNDFILGFAIRFVDDIPVSSTTLVRADDDSDNAIWRLTLELNEDLTLRDAPGTLVTTVTDPFVTAQYFFMEVRWQLSESGNFDVHLDGSSIISETAMDMCTTGCAVSPNTADYTWASVGLNYNLDDIYMYSGASGTGDFLGNPEVFRYQFDTNNSGSSNTFECVTAVLPLPLDQGVWQDMGETPLSADATEPGYTDGGAIGGARNTDDTQSGDNFRPGPSGDTNISGIIHGAKWLHRLRRTNGSGTTHSVCFGNSGDGVNDTAVTLSTAFTNFFTVSEAASEVPLSTEFFRQGFGKSSGGREIFGEEIWAFLLQVQIPQRRTYLIE